MNYLEFQSGNNFSAMTRILYKLYAVSMLNLPRPCKAIACVYVILSITQFTIPGGRVQ